MSGNGSSSLPFNCCFCPEGLKVQTAIINHLLSHFIVKLEPKLEVDSIEVQPYLCQTLDVDEPKSEFNQKSCLEDDDHNHPDTERFTCNLCFKTFLHKQGLQKHFTNEHEKPARIKYQQRSVDSLDTPKVKCDFCTKVFKYKQGAQKHWDLEHNPANSFPCPKCVSRCKTLKNLHAHLRTHEAPREAGLENLQCHKCLKIFQTQKQLTLHFYTHREKFFCCDKCGSKFNNREQIKNHVLRHVGLFQKMVSYQRIICDQCSMMVYSHKMKRHKLIHHSDEKQFKCDYPDCSAAFSDIRTLNDHKNIHLKLKPYKCEYCSEAFRSGANLRLHRVRHLDPDR